MEMFQILNKALSLIEYKSHAETIHYAKSWLQPDGAFVIINAESFYECLEAIFLSDKIVSTRFSRKIIFDFIENKLVNQKKNGCEFSQEIGKTFFDYYHKITPVLVHVTAPISGIRLDGDIKFFNLSVFKFGNLQDLEFSISNQDGMYIQTTIDNVYDDTFSIKKAENAFSDFARIIVFMSGRNNNSIYIKTGLPLCPSLGHEKIYVDTSSYQITDELGRLQSGKVESKYIEKIPLNNESFCNHAQLNKIWQLYENKHKDIKLKDIESRIINSALAVGETAISSNLRNSVIYTCIALEILFSYDEGSLFQKSIGDRLADTFSFIVANSKESRIATSSLLKKVYRMRSALVHGGDKEITNDYVAINILLRLAISELLNNSKYSHLNNIDGLYSMVKEAQNSY